MSWKQLREGIIDLILDTLTHIYDANLEYLAKDVFQVSPRSLVAIYHGIERKLNCFTDYPPYTIVRLVELVSFKSPGQETMLKPSGNDEVKLLQGLTNYKVHVHNLIDGKDSTTTESNAFHDRGVVRDRHADLKDIYAYRYLKSIEKVINVESSAQDVDDDMDRINSQLDEKRPISDVGIEMATIEWANGDSDIVTVAPKEEEAKKAKETLEEQTPNASID